MLGDWLVTLSPVLRTFVLATIAVPIVIYGLMPHLHRIRARLLAIGRLYLVAAGAPVARDAGVGNSARPAAREQTQ